MQISGTQHLNQYVARFFLEYLNKLKHQKTGSSINEFAWLYLHLSGISTNSNIQDLSTLPEDAALFLRKRVLGNESRSSMRHIVQDEPDLLPLLNQGPQSWLILTYLETLQSIFELDNGTLQYGLGRDRYRNIEENVIAARMMFGQASQRIAQKMYELYGHIGNQIALIEGGAGNGAATLTTLKEFNNHGLYPHFWLTDIDNKTLPVAENYYRQTGNFKSHHFPWSQLDIGNINAVKALLSSFSGFKTIFNVNFIAHEQEKIADKFFKAMSTSPDTDLVVSEFFLPPGYPICDPDPDFPWWFVALHMLSGQHLRTEMDFLKFPKKYGYKLVDRLDHQIHNGVPVTSTLFFTKK